MTPKIVNKDNKEKIVKLRYNRNITPVAKLWLVWENTLTNLSEQVYSLSDLEIRFLSDLYKLKIFLNNNLEYYINNKITISKFKELSDNLALKLLMCSQSELSESGIYLENLRRIFKILDIELDEINWSILNVINSNFTGEGEFTILREKDYTKYKSSLGKQYGMLRTQKSMTDISLVDDNTTPKKSPFRSLRKVVSFWNSKTTQ
jgi:hypothetical protein